MESAAGNPPVAAGELAPSAVIHHRRETCAKCEFQIDWRCEHPGCEVCPSLQEKSGGLRYLTTRLAHTCPLNQW